MKKAYVMYRCDPEVREALRMAAKTLGTSTQGLIDRAVRAVLGMPTKADTYISDQMGK